MTDHTAHDAQMRAAMPWDGRPESPERDGWHWIEPGFGPSAVWPARWCARNGGYWNWDSDDPSDHAEYADHIQSGAWKYRGPCLTPAEVAALRQERDAARREGIGAAKKHVDEIAQVAQAAVDHVGQMNSACREGEAHQWIRDAHEAAIRALLTEPRDV